MKKSKNKKPLKIRKGAQIYDFGSQEDKDLMRLKTIYTPADIRAWTRNGML